ncbi:MAG: CusA/CzcA family heavy metal efflux RND transporter [Burkholderiaceae bacterium]
MDGLIRFALGQRVFVLLLAVVLVVAGGYALSGLPIEAFPDVQDVQVQVVTLYPGQAPEDVERIVSLPIERELSGTPRLTGIRSVTMTGLSVVTLTFSDRTDDYFARQQVLEKLGNVSLPTGLQPQLAPLSTAIGEIYRYSIQAPNRSISDIRALQDWTIRPALRMSPGVADVVSFGGAVRQYKVDVDPLALRKYQVSLDQVNQALANGNGSAGGNQLRQGDESAIVRSAGLYASVDDIGAVAIAARQGRSIRVADIADVHVGQQARNGIVASDHDDDVVEGIVLMVKGGDPAKINAELKSRIALLQKRLPGDVTIKPIYDRTVLVHHTVATVAENLVVGATLVIAVLLVFLTSWRAALIVASVIPLALLFAFVAMSLTGVSANLISLGAVDFGIIIDSAVVLVEALMVKLAADSLRMKTDHRADTGEHRFGALRRTYAELAHSVLFAKVIIIVAFVPIFTFQRVEGKIFTPVALTLSFALAGAVLITFTVVPALLSYVLSRGTLEEKHKPWLDRLQAWYRRGLERGLRHSDRVIGCALAMVVVAIALAPRLGTEFLPKLDEGNIWLSVTLPTSASLDLSKKVEREVRSRLLGYPEVQHVISQVGRPDDGSDPKGPNGMELLVDLAPRSTWRWSAKEAMIEDMNARLHEIPGIETNFSQVIEDNVEEALSGSKGEIVVKITGPDLSILDQKASQVADVIRGIRGATDVDATRIGGQTELVITPDRAKLGRYGLSVSDVDTLIAEALSGSAVTAFYENERRFDVVVRVAERARASADSIANLQLTLPDAQSVASGGSIALGDVARVEVRQGASRILRESGSRLVIVKVNLIGRDQGSFVDEARQSVAARVSLPPGYELTWGGQFENSDRAGKRLMFIVPLTAVLIFCLLFWAFRSVALAALVLVTIPFTAIGGLAALGLAGLHLSVSAAVGFVAVAGISVQNGVILVEEVMGRYRNGAALVDALVDGAVARLRPILMTALMAGLGLLPAALSHGIGSETQRPFACVIVGGIVSGTLFTVFVLPLAIRRVARFMESRGQLQPRPPSEPATPVIAPTASA